jgi:lipid II:glycine glycyltransferase (peptidoglycan interpeptide bridge formation enzyme)
VTTPQYSIEIINGFSEDSWDSWDQFVLESPEAHHEQTSFWARLKNVYGWQPLLIQLKRNNRIVAGVVIHTRRFGRFGVIGYVERGPMAYKNDPIFVRLIIEELDAFAKKNKIFYLVVLPPYSGKTHAEYLEEIGFIKKPYLMQPSQLVTATLIVDVTDEEGIIFNRMRANTRRNVRRGIRAGLKFREGYGHEIEIFRKLMVQLCRRRGTSPTPPQEDFFQQAWEIYREKFVRLLVVELGGEIISAYFAFTFGEMVYLWKAGWTGEYKKYRPNDFLTWESIRWAKKKGFKKVDLVQILPEHARAVLEGKKINDSYWGVTSYKLGFGGEIRMLPEAYINFFHPIFNLGLRFAASKMLTVPVVVRLINRFLLKHPI